MRFLRALLNGFNILFDSLSFSHRIEPQPRKSDAEKLKGDWEKVMGDLNKAMNKSTYK